MAVNDALKWYDPAEGESVSRFVGTQDAKNAINQTYIDLEGESTGGRDLSGEPLLNGWGMSNLPDFENFILARTGKMVFIQFTFDSNNADSEIAYILPAGFRPFANVIGFSYWSGKKDDIEAFIIRSDGTLHLDEIKKGDQQGSLIYFTVDDFPTVLPGVPYV